MHTWNLHCNLWFFVIFQSGEELDAAEQPVEAIVFSAPNENVYSEATRQRDVPKSKSSSELHSNENKRSGIPVDELQYDYVSLDRLPRRNVLASLDDADVYY